MNVASKIKDSGGHFHGSLSHSVRLWQMKVGFAESA